MRAVSWKLCLAVFFSFISSSTQQKNNDPYFLSIARGDGVDGNLLQRLTNVGLLENTPVGRVIGRLSCADPDPGDFIAGYSGQSQTLNVSKTGQVTTVRILDSELYRNTEDIELIRALKPTFFCWDNRLLTTTVQIEISLTDVNDNAPQFLRLPYGADVPENSTIGSTVFSGISVTDADLANNARVNISCLSTEDDKEQITSCEHFAVRQIQVGDGDYRAFLILKKALDFETKRGYRMTLLAQDEASGDINNPVLNKTVNVLINVIDNQDAPPQFLNVPLTIYVQENTPMGTEVTLQISAQDGDKGSPRPVKIVIKDDPRNLFRLSETFPSTITPGAYFVRVYVNNPIDREALKSVYQFTVEAIELDGNVETNDRTSGTVRVDVLDVNDNRPTFSQDVYIVELNEIGIDQSNFQVPDLSMQITDNDIPDNARYRVMIATQTFPTFQVFPENDVIGNVAVNLKAINPRFLNYDVPQYRNQTIILEARELETSPNAPQTSTATVYIYLRDLNDNSPVLSKPVYVFEAFENVPVGTIIGTVTATDEDDGLNGLVTYRLGGTGSEQFLINSTTGEITLAEPLDYESNTVYQILLEVRDGGRPPKRITKTITVKVKNINDKGPTPFNTLYQTYAQETNTTLRPAVIVQAIDRENPNSTLSYEIIAGNTPDNAFAVNRVTGEFTLTKNIDFDDTPNGKGVFNVIIQVSDNGDPPQFANITVKVSVQDENNNAPQFLRFNYFANVSELAPEDTLVVSVSATDADKGTNGKIRYTIQSGGREHFKINPNSGVITVSSKAKFEYQDFPEYNLIVYAIDFGSPPKTGTAAVQVEVRDSNNKSPRFTQQVYVLSVREDVGLGTRVLTVSATDPDTTNLLRYSIPTTSVEARDKDGELILSRSSFEYWNAFVVDPVSGIITTNRTLSRDGAADVSFSVIVEDLNAETSEKQTASTTVLITILGTSISTIFFTPKTYAFTVTEGKTAGSLITTVAARDPACGNCLVRNYFEVPQTDALGYLQVDRETGRVTLSKTINYELPEARLLYMEIEARAEDGRSARTSIRVDVKDDNDNSPKFRQDKYIYSVSESAIYPYQFGLVKADDEDSGSFGQIEYSLSGVNSSDFQILSSGALIVSRDAKLDFERKAVYNLLVTASDNPPTKNNKGRTSTVRKQTSVSMQIFIEDVNDNTPQFTTSFSFFVVENLGIGRSVGRVAATDLDAGTNGEIYYSMKDPSNLFRITNTGYILTQRSLQDMSPMSPFFVTVRAEDLGTPSRYNETEVEIIVQSGQLDDGRPQWSIPRLGQPYFVVENTSEVQFVVQARATAKSVGPEVIYSFSTESLDYRMFKIDPVTGNVTSNGIFDWETKNVYDLILIATDKYNTSLQSLRGLTVRVIDIDDNVPDFGNCPGVSLEVPQTVTIPEDLPVETFVYQVKACDIDQTNNGVIYREERGNEQCEREMSGGYFKVDIDGVITLNKTLDREMKEYHLVCVRAYPSNGGRSKRQAADGFDRGQMTNPNHVAYVVIKISDRNDNGPIFYYPEKRLFEAITTVPTEKTVIVRVLAIDPDLPPFNRVRYSIKNIEYNEPTYPTIPLPGAFIIGPDTGIVSTNFPSYKDFRVPWSYFNITIQADDFRDGTLNDTMHLYVFIFEPSQTIRVVIDKSPDDAKPEVDNLIRDLSNADPDSLFKLQQVSYHRVIDDYDVTRTDVCFVVVRNNKVLSVREGGETLSQNKIEKVLEQYGAKSPGSCYRSRSSLDKIDWAPLWWVLVALAIFIFICCCILIAVVCILHKNYKNYMKTRKTYLVQQ